MKNEAAKLITRSIQNREFKTVLLASKAYTLYPPTLKILVRGLEHWADVQLDESKMQEWEIIMQIPTNYKPILKGLSYLVTGDLFFWKFKAFRLYRRWIRGTPAVLPLEMKRAVNASIGLMGASDFFDSAILCKSVAKMAASQR